MKNSLLTPFRHLAFLFLVGLAFTAKIHAYTFTHTIPLSQTTIDGTALGLQPGDVIGLVAGERTRLILVNINGTSANPIIIANMSGKVRIGNDGSAAAISISDSEHFKLMGDGDAGHFHGIEVHRATGGQGVQIHGRSTNFTVAHLHVHHTYYAGIMSKSDPTGTSSSPGPLNHGNFTQEDVVFHDNYVHDTGGEGFYLGSSFYTGTTTGSDALFPHDIEGMRVYNNITEHTGREGIQVGCVISDCEIYNNLVRDAGTANLSGQNNGIQINAGTTGLLYNNTVIEAPANGIALTGLGDNAAFNNVVADVGGHGFFCDNRNRSADPSIGTIPGSYIRVHNNTVVNAGQYGFRTYNELCPHEFRNNLVVNATSGLLDAGGSITITSSNNLSQSTTTGLGFVNPGIHDYRIAGSSSALNAGYDVSAHGVTFDHEGLARPFGGTFEIGAFEAGALSAVITAWTHPSLPGMSDGALTVSAVGGTAPYTYAWSHGPTTATLSGLPAGTYTVTVTDNASTQRVRAFTLVDPAPLIVRARVLPSLAGANDGSITLNPSGVSPYIITWSHGPTTLAVTGLTPGFYSYSITDANGAFASGTHYVRDGGTPIYRVNVGGNAESDRVINWAVDNPPSASPYIVSSGSLTTGSHTWSGSNGNYTEAPNNVFGRRRYDNGSGQEMHWEFPVTNGIYEVQLFFNEDNSGYGIGSRVFDVEIEGALALDALDLFALHGYNTPVQYTLFTEVSDGYLDLNFLRLIGSPAINAIAIHSHSGGLPVGTPVYRVNAGGPVQTDTGLDWEIDKNPSSISPYLASTGQLNTGPNTWSGTNTTGAPDNIFANYRYDPSYGVEMQWEFPLPPGTYRLNLYFMERDVTVTGPGQRYFDIGVEGTVQWVDHDPHASYGGNMIPGVESLLLDITDGTLDLDFFHKNTRAPIINGISIHRVK